MTRRWTRKTRVGPEDGPGWWHKIYGDPARWATHCGLALVETQWSPLETVTISGSAEPVGEMCPHCRAGTTWNL